ncbi:hypothetical protein E9993_22465 [Labilibacter sediminis]|nr:hypothetical protein E9993_22465 [Labilibacter sediminis]
MMKKFIGALVVFVFCTGWLHAQTYDLKYKLKKGTDYRFYQETVMSIIQTLGFLEQEIKNEFKGITRFTPVGTEGNNIVLKTSFETLALKIESIMFNMNYDSSKPVNQDDEMARIYNGIVGKDFKMIITPQGTVVRIVGLNELIDKAIASMGNVQPQAASKLKRAMAAQMGEKALKGNMEMILSIYPKGAKRVGDKWSTGTVLTSALKANLSNNWTLADVSDKQWKLTGDGNISAQNIRAKMHGMDVVFNLKGKQKTEYSLNQADGWFINGKQSQQIDGTVNMNVSSQLPQGMDIPMKVKSTTYIEKR